MRVIIIGASHAGISVAEKLRQYGFAGEIKLIDRLPGLPVQRPPLSKAYLKADPASDDAPFYLRGPEWFKKFDINFMPACTVTSIESAQNTLHLSDETLLSYDHLIIATGATPRPLPSTLFSPPSAASHLKYLRNAFDARALRATLNKVDKAVVIGGGYIGLEAASSMRILGLDVHVIDFAPRLLSRVATPALSAHCQSLHEAHGVHFHLGRSIKSITAHAPPPTPNPHLDEDTCLDRASDPAEPGRFTPHLDEDTCLDRASDSAGPGRFTLHLDEGTCLDSALILVGIGILPATALGEMAGLEVDNGIVVDSRYCSSISNIWAIGDVARAPSLSAVRIESIHHAQYSASIAAAALMHISPPSDKTPPAPPKNEKWWFWSDQYDVKFQIVGLLPIVASSSELTTVTRPGRKPHSHSIWTWHNGHLVTIESINDPQAYMIGKACLESGKTPSPEHIKDPDFVLKNLL